MHNGAMCPKRSQERLATPTTPGMGGGSGGAGASRPAAVARQARRRRQTPANAAEAFGGSATTKARHNARRAACTLPRRNPATPTRVRWLLRFMRKARERSKRVSGVGGAPQSKAVGVHMYGGNTIPPSSRNETLVALNEDLLRESTAPMPAMQTAHENATRREGLATTSRLCGWRSLGANPRGYAVCGANHLVIGETAKPKFCPRPSPDNTAGKATKIRSEPPFADRGRGAPSTLQRNGRATHT